MDADLKEALEAIKYLRAALWVAYDDKDEIDDNAQDALDEGERVLRKHGDSDDMMDAIDPPKD